MQQRHVVVPERQLDDLHEQNSGFLRGTREGALTCGCVWIFVMFGHVRHHLGRVTMVCAFLLHMKGGSQFAVPAPMSSEGGAVAQELCSRTRMVIECAAVHGWYLIVQKRAVVVSVARFLVWLTQIENEKSAIVLGCKEPRDLAGATFQVTRLYRRCGIMLALNYAQFTGSSGWGSQASPQ